MLTRLKSIDNQRLKEISAAFAESFLAQSGSLSSCMGYEEARRYFEVTLYEYQRIGVLYAYGENEEGYIVYHHKNKGLSWYRDLYLMYRYFTCMSIETMQKMMMAHIKKTTKAACRGQLRRKRDSSPKTHLSLTTTSLSVAVQREK